jgi:autotransporter passenger strand-loop-strand repeat protein
LRTASNTFTLEPGYNVVGTVIGSGGNTFQLGGAGPGTFDLSSVGSSAQYRGFTTFNVVGGAWTVSGSGSRWNVNGGTAELASGGFLLSTTVRSGGTLEVLSGAHVSATTVSNGGTFLVSSGGTADPTRLLSGGTEIIGSGGVDDGAQISGGVLVVQSGGSATNTDVRSGGTEAVESGAIVTGVISSGGALEPVGPGATSAGLTVHPGAAFEFASGYVNSTSVSAGTPVKVLAGGIQDGGTILSGGVLDVLFGGIASGVTVDSGGRLIVFSGGTGIDFTVDSGGTAVNSVGGSLEAVVSATDAGVLVNSGTVNVQNGATLTVGAATLNNAGRINLLGSTSQTTLFIDHNVTLSGGGTVSMSGGGSLITDSGGTHTLTNVNDKIVGVGELGGDVVNEAGGVIDGNGSDTTGQLDISATVTNAGLIEGTTSQGLARRPDGGERRQRRQRWSP